MRRMNVSAVSATSRPAVIDGEQMAAPGCAYKLLSIVTVQTAEPEDSLTDRCGREHHDIECILATTEMEGADTSLVVAVSWNAGA
jgi:hypothetical protein